MFKHIPTLCLLASSLLLAPACDEGPDSLDAEALELDGLDELDSPIEQEQTNGTVAQQLAASPAFEVLIQGAWVRTSEVLAASAIQTSDELDATFSRMEECQAAYASGDPGFWETICPDEFAAAGFDANPTTAEVAAAQQLQASFGIDQLTKMQSYNLFQQAHSIYLANGGSLPSANIVPTVINGVACDLACRTRIRDKSIPGAVHASSSTARMSEAPEGGEEGGGGGGSIISPETIADIIIIIVTATVGCLFNPDCNPWSNENSECVEDSQCPPDHWCKKGFLGWGSNQCIPQEENGESCSKDKECLSGCCNYNFFGSECAGPNKCN